MASERARKRDRRGGLAAHERIFGEGATDSSRSWFVDARLRRNFRAQLKVSLRRDAR